MSYVFRFTGKSPSRSEWRIMKLTSQEVEILRTLGLRLSDKCDGCGKLLNQSFRFTISGRPDVFCSARCCDLAFFGNAQEAKKHSTPGRCVHCGVSLNDKKRGALYCHDVCRMRHSR